MRRILKSPDDMHPVNVKIGHDDLKANRTESKATGQRRDGRRIASFAPTKQHIISTPFNPLQTRETKDLKGPSMLRQKCPQPPKSFNKQVKRPQRGPF
ncbi:unnamed protein product [marine sediment metagenome]|uniref:Uncharacterized protein n=1 Tax=marine sediment metagenome TaxID=412755 RepID=X1QNA7_9ZZZZ